MHFWNTKIFNNFLNFDLFYLFFWPSSSQNQYKKSVGNRFLKFSFFSDFLADSWLIFAIFPIFAHDPAKNGAKLEGVWAHFRILITRTTTYVKTNPYNNILEHKSIKTSRFRKTLRTRDLTLRTGQHVIFHF